MAFFLLHERSNITFIGLIGRIKMKCMAAFYNYGFSAVHKNSMDKSSHFFSESKFVNMTIIPHVLVLATDQP